MTTGEALLLQVATKAAECLTNMIAALAQHGSNALPELVLADDQVVGDLMGCLSGPKQPGSQSADEHVDAIADIIAAVCKGNISTFLSVTLLAGSYTVFTMIFTTTA